MTSISIETDTPKTPRICKACGGKTEDKYICKWCTNGFQDTEQQAVWNEFRNKMRRISSTYTLFEKVTREMIAILEQIKTEESLTEAGIGSKILKEWLLANPDTQERRDTSRDISSFQNRALIIMMKWRQGE